MATNLTELNVNNYKVPDDTSEQFNNISLFAKNMTVKDSRYFYNSETDISKWLGNLLVKYVDSNLSLSEISELFDFICSYNQKLEDTIQNNQLYRFKVFNMLKNISSDIGFIDILINELLMTIKEKNLSLFNKLVDKKDELKAFLFKTQLNDIFINNTELIVDNLKNTDILKIEKKCLTSEYLKINRKILLELFKSNSLSDNCIIKMDETLITAAELSKWDEQYIMESSDFSIQIKGINLDYLQTTKDGLVELIFNNSILDNCVLYNEIGLRYFYKKSQGRFYLSYKEYLDFSDKTNSIINDYQIFINDMLQINIKGQAAINNFAILAPTENDNSFYFNMATNTFWKNVYNLKTNFNNITEFSFKDPNNENSTISVSYRKADNTYIINRNNEKIELSEDNWKNYLNELFEVNEVFNLIVLINSAQKVLYDVKTGKFLYKPLIQKVEGGLGYLESDTIDSVKVIEASSYNIEIPTLKDAYIYLEDENYFIFSDTNNNELKFYYNPNYSSLYRKDPTIVFDLTESEQNEFNDFLNEFYGPNDSITKTTIKNAELTFLNSEKFLISNIGNIKTKTDKYYSTTKLSATENEKQLIEAGYPVNIFDLRFPSNILTDSSKKYLNKIFNNNAFPISDSLKNASGEIKTINSAFQIVYKEFNPAYQAVLLTNQVNLALNLYSGSNEKITTFDSMVNTFLDDSTIGTVINKDGLNQLRTVEGKFVISDFYTLDTDNNFNLTLTNKLYQSLYSNPYIARKAAESEIIAYYKADDYISNGYGKYKYQRVEIEQFLNIYTETRNFYYEVLLNQAFINEANYKTYEKFFLISWGIERFLTNKLETLKDIDSFNLTDIKNFLTTYGMEQLGDIIEVNDFFNSEELSKKIIKRYIDLIQNKGSHKDMEILEEVFSVNDTTLTIYKNVLVNKAGEFGFIKINYDTENLIEAIDQNIKYFIKANEFTNSDIYWSQTGTTDKILSDAEIEVVNTKYLIPEFSTNIADNYIVIRILFALIDFMIENGLNKDGFLKNLKYEGLLIDVKDGNDIIEFTKMLDYFRLLLKQYLLKNIKDENAYDLNEEGFNIKINTTYLNSLFNSLLIDEGVNNPTDNSKDKIIINQEKLLQLIHSINYGKPENKYSDNQYKIIYSCLEGLIPIYIIGKYGQNQEKFVSYMKNYFISIGSSYSEFNVYTFASIFNKILYLPLLLNSNRMENNYYNFDSRAVLFIRKLYTETFYQDNAINIFGTNSTNILTLVEEYQNKEDQAIIDICKAFSESIGATISIVLNENEQGLMSFLKSAFDYFISYLSEIYKVSYINQYNTKSEIFDGRDTIQASIKVKMNDSFYSDERLKIKIEERGN